MREAEALYRYLVALQDPRDQARELLYSSHHWLEPPWETLLKKVGYTDDPDDVFPDDLAVQSTSGTFSTDDVWIVNEDGEEVEGRIYVNECHRFSLCS